MTRVAPGDPVVAELPLVALWEGTGKIQSPGDESRTVQISAAGALSHLTGTVS